MAKRPTIGKNPLDTLAPENHLNVVLANLLAGRPRAAKVRSQSEEVEELKARLAAQEAELQALRAELARLKGRPPEPGPAPHKSEPAPSKPEPRWLVLKRLGKV